VLVNVQTRLQQSLASESGAGNAAPSGDLQLSAEPPLRPSILRRGGPLLHLRRAHPRALNPIVDFIDAGFDSKLTGAVLSFAKDVSRSMDRPAPPSRFNFSHSVVDCAMLHHFCSLPEEHAL